MNVTKCSPNEREDAVGGWVSVAEVAYTGKGILLQGSRAVVTNLDCTLEYPEGIFTNYRDQNV